MKGNASVNNGGNGNTDMGSPGAAFQGGFNIDSYLGAGYSWGNVANKSIAGPDHTSQQFKVQMTAPGACGTDPQCIYGVTQSFTPQAGSNQAFLDSIASYLGQAAGSVTAGQTIDEPVLDKSDPYARTKWFTQCKDDVVSFCDAPGSFAVGAVGTMLFRTCLLSAKNAHCARSKCCVEWTWTYDYTGGKQVNTVTQGTQSCQ